MEIPAEDVDILRLIDTSYLYGLINDGVSKYNDSNTTQITSMFDNTNTATVVGTNKKRQQVIKHRKPNLSLYMETTMVL